ncbi:MAG TPA: methyltransferase domain-containing protein, partial [Candidatus Dormibacteraeota bacterium]|nr:methyltransferase domain-containing protein [Candidatus Dormibacteraeota bacterium]
PEALVVGLDLVAGPREHPSGYRHVRGNLLQGLPFQEGVFDLVHQRLLVSGIPLGQWPRVVAELVRVTRPGGWVELVEPMMETRRTGPATERLWEFLRNVAGPLGLDTTGVVFRSLDGYLRQAGLEAVTRHECELPVGEWGGRVGSFMASDLRAGATRICEVLQAKSLLSAEEALELVRRSQVELAELRTTWTVVIAVARKPAGRPSP